jgi:transposase
VAKIICGVDVSGERLDARIGLEGAEASVARTVQGIDRLLAFCRKHGVELVVMEATGGYEKLVFSRLWSEGMACAIANPRAVRRLAEGLGLLEKTDRIDAGVIARYGEVKGLVGQVPASAAQQKLKALVTRLGQLTVLQTAQANQRRLVEEPQVLASIDAVVKLVRGQIRQHERAIADLLGQDPLWAALDESFRTIKGVADRSVARLMADLPEIGQVSNKAIAKLVGLAPLAKDSGKRAGKRSIRGGRTAVRSILFVVASVVRRYNPDFADFHKRLIAAGKPKKAVRVALARKLLVRLNAKARETRLAIQANA